MNKKGFTLVELLGVIILIGIVCVIAVPNLLGYLNTAKKESKNTLMKSIKTAAQTYYEECENGDLGEIVSTNKEKYGECNIQEAIKDKEYYLEITIGNLTNTGMLKIEEKDKNGNIITKDPVSGKDISSCKIKITKTKEKSSKDSTGIEYTTAKYTITSNGGNNCPTNVVDLGN